MTEMPTPQDFATIRRGYDPNPSRSLSLAADAYVDPRWFNADRDAILGKSWQWVCHVEKLRAPGAYMAIEIAGQPIVVLRDSEGAF